MMGLIMLSGLAAAILLAAVIVVPSMIAAGLLTKRAAATRPRAWIAAGAAGVAGAGVTAALTPALGHFAFPLADVQPCDIFGTIGNFFQVSLTYSLGFDGGLMCAPVAAFLCPATRPASDS